MNRWGSASAQVSGLLETCTCKSHTFWKWTRRHLPRETCTMTSSSSSLILDQLTKISAARPKIFNGLPSLIAITDQQRQAPQLHYASSVVRSNLLPVDGATLFPEKNCMLLICTYIMYVYLYIYRSKSFRDLLSTFVCALTLNALDGIVWYFKNIFWPSSITKSGRAYIYGIYRAYMHIYIYMLYMRHVGHM